MALLIGTDEAGYGPNFGPLTICGTAWQVPNVETELYAALAEITEPRRQRTDKLGTDKLLIGDSKFICRASGTLLELETSILSILYSLHHCIPENIAQLSKLLSCPLEFECHHEFKACASELKLPVAASRSTIQKLGTRFQVVCERHQIVLDAICCRAIFPDRFNQLIHGGGNKADLLSTATLAIVDTLRSSPAESVKIICDKHGGRSRYAGLINNCLTGEFDQIECESRRLSHYRWRENGTEYELGFQAQGESFLPTALSSMVAKYVREVSMLIWNRFWSKRIPGVQPTKGYPTDAKRFRRDIAHEQSKLGILDESIWRSR
jgi:hypothetical protein